MPLTASPLFATSSGSRGGWIGLFPPRVARLSCLLGRLLCSKGGLDPWRASDLLVALEAWE